MPRNPANDPDAEIEQDPRKRAAIGCKMGYDRLKRLRELGAPKIIIENERRLLYAKWIMRRTGVWVPVGVLFGKPIDAD